MAPRLARSLLGAAVSVLLFACTPDEPGTVVRDDDKVRYVVHGDAKVSEAAIDRVVAQIAELSALFGVEPKKVEYHFFESRERLDDGNTCNVETPAEGVVTGCAIIAKSTVLSTLPVHTHELVHLVSHQRFGALPSGLGEGIAVVLSSDSQLPLDLNPVRELRPFQAEDWLDPRRSLAKTDSPPSAYAEAAQNTRFVLDLLGWDGLLEFAEDVSALKSADGIPDLIEKHFERTLEELEADFAAWPRYPSEAHHWVLESAWVEMEPEEERTITSSEVQLVRFEHSVTERTVFTLGGGGFFDIVSADGGRMHPARIPQLSLDVPTHVAFEGPSGIYFLMIPKGSGVVRVSLDRVALDTPLSTFPLIVVAPGESSSPLCVEAETAVENRTSTMAVDVETFATGRPTTFDVCRGDDCTTFDAWVDDRPYPITFEPPACMIPGAEYPSIFDNAGLLLTAAPASGRFLTYQLRDGQ